MTAETEYLFDNRSAEAGERFSGLTELFNPITFAHLDAIGLREGWRCWEVGAGGPSVASGIAARVGNSGHVLATDIDTSWFAGAASSNLIVSRHDVAADPPPEVEGFDLVHARLVLIHVRDRDAALENMIAALRPGGWIVLEDFDMDLQPPHCIDDRSPHAALAQKICDGLRSLLISGGVDPCYGRKLPRLLREHGLTPVRADAYFPLALPATTQLMRANISQVRAGLVANQLASDEEIDTYLSLTVDLTTPPLVSSLGQKPPRSVEVTRPAGAATSATSTQRRSDEARSIASHTA